MTTEVMTLETFQAQTGLRFRVTREQNEAIKNGTLTREEAFQQALDSGEINRRIREARRMRDIWSDPTLTLDNFKEKTGKRFRLDRERSKLVESKVITRQEAFEQVVQEKLSQLEGEKNAQ